MAFDPSEWEIIDTPQSGNRVSIEPIGGGAQKALPFDPNEWEVVGNSEPQSLLSRYGTGLANSVNKLPDTLSGLGQGISNLFSSPIETITADPKQTLDTTGRLAAGTSGAISGALLGAPLAPFTLGLAPVITGAIGSAAGLYGYKKANQAAGNEAPTTLPQDVEAAGEDTGLGLMFGAAGKGASATAKGVSAAFKGVQRGADASASGFAESAFGVRPKDILKSMKKTGQYVDDTGNQVSAAEATDKVSRIQKSIAALRESELGAQLKNNPKAAEIQLGKELDKLNTTKNSMTSQIDEVLTQKGVDLGMKIKLKPDWSIAEDFIKSGKGTAGFKPALMKELETIKADWKATNGTFKDLIEFKSQVDTGKLFGNAPASESVSRALREKILVGIKKAGEEAADNILGSKGQWESINKQISQRMDVKPYLDAKAVTGGGAASRAIKDLASVRNLVLATPGVATGFAPQVAAALGAKSILEAFPASTMRGFGAIARGAGKVSSKTSSIQKALEAVNQRGAGGIFASASDDGSTDPAMFENKETETAAQPRSIQVVGPSPKGTPSPSGNSSLSPLLDAIRLVESSGGKNTLGPMTKYGQAKGPYQILDSTGKEYHKKLGIQEPYDPFNEEQSRVIAEAIILDYSRKFGSLEKGVLAYHTGPGNVQKGNIGPQGRAYVPKIIKALESLA